MASLRLFAAWRLCVRIVFKSIHNTRDAIFDQGHLEVDQQAKTLVCQPEIGQKLLLVNRGNHFDGFDFHDDLVFHDQVSAECDVNADVLLDDWNRLLAHRVQTPAAQLICHDRIVNGFE